MDEPGKHPASGSPGPVTSEDVARSVGLSRGAVSRILNGDVERFAPATRDRVLMAARELGYEPSFAGRTLARGHSDSIVVVVPHTTFGANLQDIIDGVGSVVARAGFTLLVYFETSEPEGLSRLIRTIRPTAVLPIGELGPELRRSLSSRGGPAMIGSVPGGMREAVAVIGSMQAEHLISKGLRRLQYANLIDPRENVYGLDRQFGFERTCAEHDVELLPAIEVGLSGSTADLLVADLGATPVGMGCYNDDVAMTLVSAVQRRGLRVPDDVALIGVDRTPLGQAITPMLTTLGYDGQEIGRAMARQVLVNIGIDIGTAPQHNPALYEVIQGETT